MKITPIHANVKAESFRCRVLGWHKWKFVGYMDEINPKKPGWEWGEPPMNREVVYRCERCKAFEGIWRNMFNGAMTWEYFRLEEQPEYTRRAFETFLKNPTVTYTSYISDGML